MFYQIILRNILKSINKEVWLLLKKRQGYMALFSCNHFNSSLPSGFILNSKILFALSLRLNFLIIKTFFIRLTSITVPISAMPLKNISSSGFEFIMLMNFVATITHSRFLNSLNRYLMLSSFEFISSGSIESITSLFILYFVSYLMPRQ